MDCNVLRIVQGNDFSTRMTIKAVGIDGSPIPDFSLENSTDIVVKYKSASGEYEIDEYTIEGNSLFINWSGLGLGGYGFEITGVYNNAAWRYAARLIFRIVADQASANIPAGTLVNGVYVLDGWIAFLANTGSGGVESVNGRTGIVILTPEDIGAYEKPSAGIPKSDLASAVQASLNKADTALQNIKTVNNQSLVGTGNVSVGTYDKPANGIPATDLDSSVQQTLQDVANIEGLIPLQASSSNQLADKNFVNNQVSTNTANFVGTYNSLAELQAVTGATNNDYGFVIEYDSLGNEYYDRYKYNGSQWLFEYKVESTPFTAEQWAAIQSGITSTLVTKLSALPTNSELNTQLNGKQDTLVSGTNIKTINNESILGSGNIEIQGGGGGAVASVNGKTGEVVLDAEDVGAATAAQVQSVADDVATNTQNIENLQAAYEGLTQSDIVPLDTLPASGEANTIYRVAGTDSYTDYMWDGSDFVPMATYSGMFGEGVYDISAEHSGATYDNLTAALGVDGANVPSFVRKGGMSVKYIENIYAEYDVVVTDCLSTQPSGTALDSASLITDGTYKAAQLTDFSTLPTLFGASLTYYVVVTGDTTTYTQWVITKVKNDSVKYVQYRLNDSAFSTDITDWQKCVEDYDAIRFKMTSGVRVSRADGQLATDSGTEASDFIDIRGYDKIFITTKLYNAFSNVNDSVVFVYDINGVPRIILDPRDYSSQRQTQINIIGKEYVVQENDAYIRLTNYVGSNYANYTTPYVFVKKNVEYNTSKIKSIKLKDVLNNPISTWYTAGTSGATNFRLFCPLIIAGLEDVRITLKLKDNSWQFVFIETNVFTNPNTAQAMYDSGWMRYVENYTPHTSAPILCIRVNASNKSSSSAINDWKDAISEFYIEYTNSAEKCSHELITLNASEILINERCKKIQTSLFPLNFEEVIGINHRGYNSVAPENTLPAYKLSAVNGFKFVETDIRFTSDGVAVLLHDASINRTARNADGTSISGTVNIADITYEQALAYDFGIAKSTDYAGTKIPTLREFLLLCRNAKLQPFLELKAGTSSQIKQVVDIVGEYNMKGRVFYSSPEYIYLLYVDGYDKDAALSYVISTTISQTIIDNVLYLKNNGHYITISSNSQSSDDIELCKTNGIPYILWTIDNESTIINANPYICGFTSNSLNATKVLYDSAIE